MSSYHTKMGERDLVMLRRAAESDAPYREEDRGFIAAKLATFDGILSPADRSHLKQILGRVGRDARNLGPRSTTQAETKIRDIKFRGGCPCGRHIFRSGAFLEVVGTGEVRVPERAVPGACRSVLNPGVTEVA